MLFRSEPSKKHSENMAQEPTSAHLFVDEFYFSALLDQLEDTEDFVVSDAKYAEELQFQEALMASVEAASNTAVQETAPSIKEIGSSSGSSSAADAAVDMAVVEEGQTSENFCEICAEMREVDEMFRSGKCCHTFCSYCISKHVAVKIQESVRMVTCPALSCEGVLEVDDCRGIVAREVMEKWEEVSCESIIAASQRFYCPFRDCSAMLVDDNGGEVIRESECPVCRRLFCATCYVPWHSGVGCEEYQMMNEDEKGREDLMLRELAQEKKWRRCPQCKFYVEKIEGCLHITCRCTYQFCYACGAQWTQHHGGCQTQ